MVSCMPSARQRHTESPPVFEGFSKSERAVGYWLLRRGAASRAELVASTALSRPTVYRALDALGTAGLATVTPSPEAASNEGRRVPTYRLTANAGVAVGVEIGRRHITVDLVDAGHRQVCMPLNKAIEASADEHPADVLRQCAALVRGALGEAEVDGKVLGIAIGLPQPVTSEGRLGTRTLMPAWADLDPAAILAPELDIAPVYIGNEADFGAFGEYVFGAGEARRDLTYVKLGTGIGAGAILNGQLHRGASGVASEFGHVTIDYKGRRCPCGNRGCLERYAGGKALLDEARDAGLDISSLPDLVQRARSGDMVCQRIITEAAAMIGTALGALINLSGPDLIVLGGSLSAAGELLTRPLRVAMEQAAFPPAAQAVSIEAARLDRLASARGAAAFVFESLATRQNLCSSDPPRRGDRFSLPAWSPPATEAMLISNVHVEVLPGAEGGTAPAATKGVDLVGRGSRRGRAVQHVVRQAGGDVPAAKGAAALGKHRRIGVCRREI